MRTAPHDILGDLREKAGTDQMAVFAEALIENSEAAHYSALPMIAAAYMLGRVDALKQGVTECNGSAGAMAEAVLQAKNLIYADRSNLNDVPF